MSTELVQFSGGIETKVHSELWFQRLIEDCKDIIVESEFTARWALVEGYHALGKRLLEDEANFTKGGYTIDGMTSHVSSLLGKSQRTIQRAIQFAKLYPDLNLLPEGKNTNWRLVCQKYLTQQKETSRDKPPEEQKEEYVLCARCGSEVMPLLVTCRCGQQFELKSEMIRK